MYLRWQARPRCSSTFPLGPASTDPGSNGSRMRRTARLDEGDFMAAELLRSLRSQVLKREGTTQASAGSSAGAPPFMGGAGQAGRLDRCMCSVSMVRLRATTSTSLHGLMKHVQARRARSCFDL